MRRTISMILIAVGGYAAYEAIAGKPLIPGLSLLKIMDKISNKNTTTPTTTTTHQKLTDIPVTQYTGPPPTGIGGIRDSDLDRPGSISYYLLN